MMTETRNKRRHDRRYTAVTVAWCALFLWGGAVPIHAQSKKSPLVGQTSEDVARKSNGCLTCHGGVEKMHESPTVRLGCIDCHGGNPEATTKAKAHISPKYPDEWPSSANPERSYTLLNREKSEFIQFVNPADLRVVHKTCAPCHATEVENVGKSMMTTSSMFWAGAAYNNGIISTKHSIFGESYSEDGTPQRINTVPAPTQEELDRGVLPYLLPLPRWEITQVGNIFRTFERGGKIPRINPSLIGIPNPLEEPGRPDMKLGDRGLGTQLRISSPVLNLMKTRLNDPHLSFLGTNDHPGDYRSAGCAGCHVIYANDRSPVHSGPYAKFGNRGFSFSADTTMPKMQAAHPITHRFTRKIPSSQCIVCHMHQPNGFMNTYFGYQMWDYETEAKDMYPEEERSLSRDQQWYLLDKNPEEAVLRGNWGDYEFLTRLAESNPDKHQAQFSDYHGHGWVFRAVFKKDRKGRLLDAEGNVIPEDSEHKFHGVVPLADGGNHVCDQACQDAQKAVHLKDIHAERGMHCVDCHFQQDNHSDGKLYGEFHNALEISCIDCHGTVAKRANLKSSGLAAPAGGSDFKTLYTPDGRRRFVQRGGKTLQRSMLFDTLEWVVPQLVDVVDPESEFYNDKAARAKLVTKIGEILKPGAGIECRLLAHNNDKMECYTCHTSWVTNCFGCHLPQQANWKQDMKHFEGGASRNWTTYNPQVIRDDGFMLCMNAHSKGNKVSPARSSSALILSSRNANREQVYTQQPPISAPGLSSQAFNPHFAHTVRTTETRTCVDCHLSADNDNNAWMAQVMLHGTGFVNFIGKYAYVGTGRGGLEAVAVTETDEPQAVIGSYLHGLAFPDSYKQHQQDGEKLATGYHHGATDIRSLQMRGEYLFTANGTGGFRVFDIANIDNKGFSERIVSSPVSKWGQNTHVKTAHALSVALPTTMPIDTRRQFRPENLEQGPLHPLYSYAYIADSEEGLITVDVMSLADGDPLNNHLKRAVTFNPDGALKGARYITLAGHFAYICCDAGMTIVSLKDPLSPQIVSVVGSPDLVAPISVAIQFRYAFVCDAEGVQVVDITDPSNPRFIKNNSFRLADARDIYVARTYAYVAAGKQGLAILDITNPERLKAQQIYTAGGALNDAQSVRIGATNASIFAYVADGVNGLRVIQLTSPETSGHLGFSPVPEPRLIATYKTHAPALALSRGLDRDRAVDETGHQVSVFGRLGSRPFTDEEQKRLYLRNGRLWYVGGSEGPVIPRLKPPADLSSASMEL